MLGVHCEGVAGYHRFLLVKLFQPLDDGASTWYAQLRSSALMKSSVQDVRAVRTSAEPSPVRLFSLLNMGYIWQNHRREPDGDASIPLCPDFDVFEAVWGTHPSHEVRGIG